MTNAFAQPHAPDTLWTRDYVDSNTALYPASIMSTPDGGFAVAGTWGYFDYLNYDAGLMKMGSDGTVQWSHRFGVPEVLEYVTCAAHTTDGGFFLAGFTQGQDTSESHLLAVKYDWAGDSLWSLPIRIDGGAPSIQAATELSNGDLALGYTMGGFPSILWISPSGSLIRYRSFAPLPGYLNVRAIVETTERNIVLAGYMNMVDTSHVVWRAAGAICVDSAGYTLWTLVNPITPHGDEAFHSLVPLADGTVMVAGWEDGPDGSGIALFHLDVQGNIIWTGTYNFAIGQEDVGQRIILHALADGGYMIAATIHRGTDGGLLFRVTSQGDTSWSLTYGRYLDDFSSASVDTVEGGGYVWALYALNLFTVIRLGSDTENAVVAPAAPHPSSFNLSSFPNPFNPATEIRFSIPKTTRAKLEVFDITGHLVKTLADRQFYAGEHSILLDGSTLASGIYFARLKAGEFVRTQKMVLLK